MILVVLENQRGKIHPFSIEALVAGQKFAKNLNCDLAVLCIGEKVEELKSQAQNFKSSKLILAKHSLIDMYSLTVIQKFFQMLLLSFHRNMYYLDILTW